MKRKFRLKEKLSNTNPDKANQKLGPTVISLVWQPYYVASILEKAVDRKHRVKGVIHCCQGQRQPLAVITPGSIYI